MPELNKTFTNRVWFVGSQGSYSRVEATVASDIDVVVFPDKLSVADIQAYNAILATLSHREMLCGFLSGNNEITNWDTSDFLVL